MAETEDPVGWYDSNAAEVDGQYEAVDPVRLHAWFSHLLPYPPAVVLDVGSGSGRDAAWLASLGFDVVAVEPAASLRRRAMFRHPDPRIQWVDDRLPDAHRLSQSGMAYDAILCSAVWQHIHPSQRQRAFRKLIFSLKPGGLLIITLRLGPAPPGRVMHEVSQAELEALARDFGLATLKVEPSIDQIGRTGVSWIGMAFRLPDDGTGALPLLRHVILRDDKSSTYKLGLLRTLCRAADSAAGLARQVDDDRVEVPLGLVALFWIRLYLPLIRGMLPQTPTNVGADGLGFAKDGFRALLVRLSATDLRVGMRVTGDLATALHAALRDAAETIDRMPSTYMTYPNGGRIFPCERTRPLRVQSSLDIEGAYLSSFGTLSIPSHLWRAMQRYSSWIEPSLIAEWIRLMRGYAERQGRDVDEAKLAVAMTWADPTRDVSASRTIALQLLDQGRLHCAWTGQALTNETLDIDHLLPWSAWACGDLWNLLPTHRHVNQRLKRERIPSAATLGAAEDRIMSWWATAYVDAGDPARRSRFEREALASLPGVSSLLLPDVFAGVALRRTQLRHDQQVPEWPSDEGVSRSTSLGVRQ